MKFRSLLYLLGCFLFSSSLFATTITSTGTGGNWTTNATWSGNVAPVAGDDVIIASGATVSMDATSTCLSLTINGTGILDFPTNNIDLNLTNNLTMNGNSQITGNSNTRHLNVGGNLTVPVNQIGSIGGIRLNVTGTTNINGYFAFANSGVGNKFFNNTITVAVGGMGQFDWRGSQGKL